jgi:LysM repeat protein
VKYPIKTITFRFLLFFGLFCFPAFKAFSQSATEEYIQKYKTIAEEEMQRTGVPAAISLAQGIIESQSGAGWLVEHSRNHFGIKCKNDWSGQTIQYDDDHKNECFRVYDTDDSSWRDHSDFLKNTPRYAFLFYLDPLDYKAWAYGLRKAGYATNKQYAEKLINTIETYHLQQYSAQAIAGMKSTPQNDFAVMLDKKVEEDRKAMGIAESRPVVPTVEKSSALYPAGLFQINNRNVLYLPEGTQLIAIADKYHIRLNRLLGYNELQSDVLSKDMLIYLTKKGKTGAHATHTVVQGETLHEIAQKEGIRLKWLCRRNNMHESDVPAAGNLLYLNNDAPTGGRSSGLAENGSGKGFWYKLTHFFSGHKKEAPVQSGPVDQQDQQSIQHITSYQVKSGDTLYSISKKYGVSTAQIQEWNHLQDNLIQTGQELIIKNK